VQVVSPTGAPLLSVERLALGPGDAIGLSGPSGCGKSTLLRVIAGLDPVHDGEVWVAGQAMHALRPTAAARVRGQHLGLIPQGLHLHPALNIEQNVLVGGIFACDGQAGHPRRARDLLDALGLGDRLAARPASLSLGEQQRVAVARALIHRPALVLADEPTASLDPAAADRVLAALTSLCADSGAALVLVSHDPRVLAALPTQHALRV
jgi:putative ABC transport system ATP-binding protein